MAEQKDNVYIDRVWASFRNHPHNADHVEGISHLHTYEEVMSAVADQWVLHPDNDWEDGECMGGVTRQCHL